MQQSITENVLPRVAAGQRNWWSGFSPRVLLIAALAGIVSGLTCVGLRLTLRLLQWVITGHGGLLADAANALPLWRRFLTPVVGGIIATLVIEGSRRFRGTQKALQYVEAVRFCHGHIPFVTTSWQTVASAVSIASGAAIGREGSMIQFAAATVSNLGQQWRRVSVPLPTLVAMAVAGAVAGVYQAPIAGAFFALEIVLGVNVLSLGTVAAMPALFVSAVAGTTMSHFLLGPGPLFPVSTPIHFGWLDCLPILMCSAALGAVAPAYFAIVKSARFLAKWPWPMAWSGVVVGLLSCYRPATWGNADSSVIGIVSGHLAFESVTIILLVRLCATAACVGSGVVGGVFTPTVFAGSALGLLLGGGIQLFVPHASSPVSYAVLGIGCLLAAVTHAPLMSAFMAVELTGTHGWIAIALLCSLFSSEISRKISPGSLYAVATPDPGKPLGAYCGDAVRGFSGSRSN